MENEKLSKSEEQDANKYIAEVVKEFELMLVELHFVGAVTLVMFLLQA